MRKSKKKLVEFRKSLGMTQTELARRLGILSTMLSNYEQGRTTPMMSVWCKMMENAQREGIALSESLFDDDDEGEKEPEGCDARTEVSSLRVLRAYAGLTQTEIAREIAGMDLQRWGKLERGEVETSLGVWLQIQRYAKTLGLRLIYRKPS